MQNPGTEEKAKEAKVEETVARLRSLMQRAFTREQIMSNGSEGEKILYLKLFGDEEGSKPKPESTDHGPLGEIFGSEAMKVMLTDNAQTLRDVFEELSALSTLEYETYYHENRERVQKWALRANLTRSQWEGLRVIVDIGFYPWGSGGEEKEAGR